MLNYSIQVNLFQLKNNCIRTEGVINHIIQGFGHLYYILCLVTEDEMNSIADIEGGKLARIATRIFGKDRALLGLEPRDVRDMYASIRSNGVSIVTKINHGRMVLCQVTERDYIMIIVWNKEVWEGNSNSDSYLHVNICLYSQKMSIHPCFD